MDIKFVLITLSAFVLSTLASGAEYPAVRPAEDTSSYGKHFQRAMTLMASSTALKRNTVRILFYGQSIVAQRWHTMVMEGLKKRYPHTDFVVENRAIGGFSSQLLIRTLHYDVIPWYPDLIVFHVYGAHNKYEDVIREFRTRTTAEVIMQSDHANKWPEAKCTGNFWTEQKVWEDKMNYGLLPAIAAKFKCAWQPQRWEWVDYMKANNYQPQNLLKDGVHLNKHGEWLMAELLKRFLVYLSDEPQDEWKDLVTDYEIGKKVEWKGDTLTLPFEGNRIVLLAGEGPSASATVTIDGKKVSEHPECYAFTRPSKTPAVGWPAIAKIAWTKPLVLETWTATCSKFNGNQKDFEFTVEGSLTGPDGSGRGSQPFTSNSGRIQIELADWVFEYDKRVGNKPCPDGFKVKWTVELLGTDTYTAPEVKDPAKEYATLLASDLANDKHTLVLRAKGTKPAIRSIRVYKPPFKK